MLIWLKTVNGGLVEVETAEQAEIIRLARPTDVELLKVRQLTGIPMEFLSAAMDRDERPRMESDGDAKLLVLRVPYEQINSDIPFLTLAIGIILTPRYIVSVCAEELPFWRDLLSQTRCPSVADRFQFLCALFIYVARLYLSDLRVMRAEAEVVEHNIHFSMKNEHLIQMLNLEKCLVYFTTSLRANSTLPERIRRIPGRELTEEERDMLEDVIIEFRQAQELAEIHSNILSGMMDAFASVISNNLTVVMKFLTSVTIILMIPTLIASIYGMNVELPFQHSPHAFAITVGISLLLSIVGVAVFWMKDWF